MDDIKCYTQNSLKWHAALEEKDYAPAGKLYADGLVPTGLSAGDLPEYYVSVRVDGIWGYLSARNISSLMYRPCFSAEQDGRSDMLYICYDGAIVSEEKKRIRSDFRLSDSRQIKRFFESVIQHSPMLDTNKTLRQISMVEAWRDMGCPEPGHFQKLFLSL